MIIFSIPSAPSYGVNYQGDVFSLRDGIWRQMRVQPSNKGMYLGVTLKRVKRRVLVHALVAETFLGPKPLGFEVSHKDGNGRNNCAANLEYLSHADNIAQKKVHGTERFGERNHFARLNKERRSVDQGFNRIYPRFSRTLRC